MKEIYQIIFRMVFLFIALVLAAQLFKKADEKTVLSPAKAVYSKGNSPYSIRMEIIEQLRIFQNGYSKRDTN